MSLLTLGLRGLGGSKNFISVGDLDQSLQEQSVGYLCADVAVFAGTVALEKVLTLPAVVLDLGR